MWMVTGMLDCQCCLCHVTMTAAACISIDSLITQSALLGQMRICFCAWQHKWTCRVTATWQANRDVISSQGTGTVNRIWLLFGVHDEGRSVSGNRISCTFSVEVTVLSQHCLF